MVPRVCFEKSKVADCYNNVLTHIETHGGKLLTGWAIRIWPRAFIEAEQHAIWQSNENQLRDITPHAIGEENTMFTPCDTLKFSAEGLALNLNKFEVIAVGRCRKKVVNMIKAATRQRKYEFENRKVVGGVVKFLGNEAKLEELRSDFLIAARHMKRCVK